MTPEQICRLSIEWWKVQPPAARTRATLQSILEHYATVYAYGPERLPGLTESAWDMIPAWMKGDQK